MTFDQLQTYNFISIHPFCCTEGRKIAKILPKLLPSHEVQRIDDPIRRINFKQKVRMGELESCIHGVIYNIDNKIKSNPKFCINLVPLFDLYWIQLYKKVSPYLVEEATELFKKIDLLILPVREELIGRNGDPSWFVKSKKAKDVENNNASNLSNLLYNNNIDYISTNKLLRIAQEKGAW